MAKKMVAEGHCDICGQVYEAFFSGYREFPWVNGKCYKEICHVCANVPIYISYDEKNDLWVDLDVPRIRTLEEMISDGWGKEESKISIRAVKQHCKNIKK